MQLPAAPSFHEARRSPVLRPRALFRRVADLLANRPFLSVLLSVVGFSFFGPLAALILVATMLDHEFAHRALMRRLGYRPGPVQVIPFMGAFVRAGMPMLRSADIALIYLAGPLAGILSAACAALLASHALEPSLQHQVYIGATISIALNLFNLIPIEPLDGGLISRVVPYPALLLFPTGLALFLLRARVVATPLGLTVLLGSIYITLRKVVKWHRYVATLHARVSAGDLAALRELRASFEVPLLERLLVILVYCILVPGAFALLHLLSPFSGLFH